MEKHGQDVQDVAAHGAVAQASVRDAPAGGLVSSPVRRRRDVAVETLRLLAIAGIAVFHTFQPYFNAYAYGQQGVPVSWIGGGSAFVLGLISLLGAAGNSVFFMISGFYLLPRQRARALKPGYWRREGRDFARRAGVILVSVALYLLIGLVAQALGAPVFVAGRTCRGWLAGGLEFIWLYLVFLALAPVLAWIGAHRPLLSSAVFWVVAAGVLALDVWIAFVDRGSFTRGLFDWRKLMSAATYLVAFLLAGLMGEDRRRTARLARPVVLAAGVLVLGCEAAAAVLAAHGRVFLLGALAYKSTSLLSLLLAAGLLALAVRRSLLHPAERVDEPEPAGAAVVRRLASSILGFYICQSLLFVPWHMFSTQVLAGVAVRAGAAVFFIAGLAASLVYALVLLLLDRLVRPALLRALRLAR